MASKAVSGSKRGMKSRGLGDTEPKRRRRNTTVANNERHGLDASTRKSAGGLGRGVEPAEGRRKASAQRSAPAADDGSEIGRRVGHSRANVKRAQARPEKTRRNRPVDTAKKGVAADDRKVGKGHTAQRNTKLNTEGMAYMLEDSAQDRPSRKSTRRATNRVKPSQLTRRTKRAVRSPKVRAGRASATTKRGRAPTD